jgi:hypothetical protein
VRACLGVGLSVLVSPFLMAAAALLHAWAGRPSPPLVATLLAMAAGLLPACFSLLYGGLSGVAALLERRVQALAGAPLSDPKQAPRLAATLELTGEEAWTVRLAEGSARTFAAVYQGVIALACLAIVLFSLFSGRPERAIPGAFVAALLGALVFTAGGLLLQACGDAVSGRARLVQSIQNRLVASSKR